MTPPRAPFRILRIITRLNIGGPAIHAALLSTRLDPQRYATCLVVGRPDTTEGDLRDLVRDPRARVVTLGAMRRPIHPLRDLVAWWQLMRLIWQERPQLIHTHMAKAGALGRLAGWCYNTLGPGRRPDARAVVVHTFHGHVLEGYFALWVSALFVIIERWLARRTDCLIAVSPSIRDALLTKGIGRPSQWRVIPLGLDLANLAQLPLSNGSSAARVGLVGRLVPIKNPGLFLDALARLTSQHPEPVMSGLIVGDGPLRRSLERQSVQLGLGTQVRFTGWQRDLRAVYGQLDVVCVTSWNEGTPVSLIEAMAAGCAVVATAVGGIPDLLDGDPPRRVAGIPAGAFQMAARGLLVRPGDVEGLVVALKALVADPALRRRLGEAGRCYAVQHFSAERLLQGIPMLYEQLRRECVPCTP